VNLRNIALPTDSKWESIPEEVSCYDSDFTYLFPKNLLLFTTSHRLLYQMEFCSSLPRLFLLRRLCVNQEVTSENNQLG